MRKRLFLTALLLLPLSVDWSYAQETTNRKASDRIHIWIRDLSSSRFSVRERATQSLAKAGVPAVQPLAKAFLNPKDLESQLRIEQLLKQFLQSKNAKLKERTKKAVAQLADSGKKEIADWAEALLITAQTKNFVGTLRTNDPRDRVRRSHPHKVHLFKMVKGRTYVIDLVARFDTYLRLEDSNSTNLAMDDDGGNGLNSRIVFMARRTDTHRIIVTNFSRNGVGPYTLTVQYKGR